MTPLETIKQALEYLRNHEKYELPFTSLDVEKNLQVAIEEMEKVEPFGWYWDNDYEEGIIVNDGKDYDLPQDIIPLYSHPAPIPDGWQIVPIEPTEAMINAGDAEIDPGYCEESSASRFIEDGESMTIYQAMLAAAPKLGDE